MTDSESENKNTNLGSTVSSVAMTSWVLSLSTKAVLSMCFVAIVDVLSGELAALTIFLMKWKAVRIDLSSRWKPLQAKKEHYEQT